jgi:FtsP/CotA-like multicopper oxidase with cupredoxin domain
LNDSSFRIDPSRPILHTLLDNPLKISEGINTALFDPTHQFVYTAPHMSVIDILVQNFDDGSHPFHLHGNKFWILGAGHGYPPPNFLDTVELGNLLRRDTASLEAFGWLAVRWVADNRGVWAWHCHNMWHAEAGLGMVFGVGMEGMEIGEGEEGRSMCGVEDGGRGMGPDDSLWVGQIE